jgi:hypothetical protein
MKAKARGNGITHQVAHCQNCNWKCEDYRNGTARKKAREHAKTTGHVVTGETGMSWNYNVNQ